VTHPLAERTAAWFRERRHPVILTGLALVALQLLTRGWALSSNWFYTDDYALLRDAGTGLSGTYLLDPLNSHLMPGTRLLAWLVAESGNLNWPLAASITLVLQALASVAALWMLLGLFGRRWGVLALLVVYLTTAITAQATLWWISSLNQIPVQLGFFVAVGGGVRYLRSRRLRWLVTAVAGLVVGLLFFQKALLSLPVLAFLALAYFAGGGPVARFLVAVRRFWPAVVAVSAVSLAYLAYFLTQVEQPLQADTSASPVALAENMVGSAFITGALGGPWRWSAHQGGAWADPPLWVTQMCWVTAALVVAYAFLRRHATLRAWALLAGYLTVSVLLVALSRGLVYGNEIGLAYRFQTDVVCVLVLSLGLAFLPVPGAVESSHPREEPLLRLEVPGRAVVAGVVVLGLSGSVNWFWYAHDWKTSNASRSFVDILERDLRRNEPVDVADTVLPRAVMPAIFAPDNRISSLAVLLPGETSYPDSTDRLAVVGDRGTMHQALIETKVASRTGPADGCGWRVTARGLEVPLRGETIDTDWWLRIGYLGSTRSPVRVTAGDSVVPGTVYPGLNSLYVRVAGTFDAVRIDGLSPGATLCIDTVEVGLLARGPRL
jgi:hypothetical protein